MAAPLELTHFRYEVDADGVATVLFDRAGERMNTLSPELFGELMKIADRIESDPAVVAVVLASAKPDNFIAGADIRWLDTLTDTEAIKRDFTTGKQVLLRLQAIWKLHGKPVVAAIHGPCLGGGLEVALTAEMRVCSDDNVTQLGQPEIKLGLIPAGGGTQQLPRLVGIATGLDLILTGRAIRPARALDLGLVDDVVSVKSLVPRARAMALDALRSPRRTAPVMSLAAMRNALTSLLAVAVESNRVGRMLLFRKAERAMLAETKGNYPAPPAALRAVKAGIDHGIDVGLDVEIDEFCRVAVTSEAKALISLFLASQQLRQDPGIDGDAAPREVSKIGVLGGGLMGGGIAAVNTTQAQVTSRIKEVDDAGVKRGLDYVHRIVTGLERRGRLDREQSRRALELVTGTTNWDGLDDCDLVIEAVFEDLELKRAMLAEIEQRGLADVIFASNTSSIPIADIAYGAARPDQVIGMHYFSPVEKMPLLEIVTTATTADWVTATCVAFGKRQGKTVIVVNDGAGFYTTRILAPYANEAFHLLGEGVGIEEIDGAMVDWGFPVGPLTLSDEVGIDVVAKISRIMHPALGDRFAPPEGLARMEADGRKGRKNGRGYYRYENGERKGVDESVYEVLGISKHTQVTPAEIQQRLVLQLINEAARCLEEGILRSARDGDIGAVFGLGFPPFRGGPFMWVDTVGCQEIVAGMQSRAAQHGPRFDPARILRDHAQSGEQFRPK